MKSRRDFIIQSALTAGALSIGLNAQAKITKPGKTAAGANALKIAVFSKNLHWLGYEEMAIEAAAMGFDGIDLTVRPNGHVLPERVEQDLPKAVNIIRKHGLEVNMITTAITDATDPFTERILKTASQAGIKYYRLGWFTYDNTISIPDNIKNFHNTFLQLQKLNVQYNIHGDYQNHAGESFGSPVLDLSMAFAGINPSLIGCQYDIRHATVEGANSWPIGLNLVKDYIKTINIKDFKWAKTDGQWKEQNVPLGEGMVNFKKYFELLRSYQFNGPICIHYEYPLGGAENGDKKITIAREKVFESMRKDLKMLKLWLTEAGF